MQSWAPAEIFAGGWGKHRPPPPYKDKESPDMETK